MRSLRAIYTSLASKIPARRFAQVHDVRIETSSVSQPSGQGKGKGSMERNVFRQPLQLHSTRPLTGYLRTGYCEAPNSDYGNHSVAAVVSEEFLDFTASRGNDLRGAGLTGGCKWCLCVSRWKEAFDARSGDDDKKVPRVVLGATNERALEGAKLEELRKFAVDGERGNGNGGS